MNLDAVAIIVSLISLSFAIISFFIQLSREKKINRINLESEYFSEIYKEHLIKNIPNARRYINFIGEKFTGTENMIDLLQEIQRDSLYYYYKDPKFYQKMKEKIQVLEDFLAANEGKMYQGEEQTEIMNKIKSYIEDIYGCICNYMVGE